MWVFDVLLYHTQMMLCNEPTFQTFGHLSGSRGFYSALAIIAKFLWL